MVAMLPTWTKAVRKFQRNFHSGNFHRLGTGHGRPVLEGVAFAPVEMNPHHTPSWGCTCMGARGDCNKDMYTCALIPVWISPMGSRPSFCTKVLKFLTSAIIKWWLLNLQRITENGNMILLQNEDWFLSWGYLKGRFHHYKMKIGFYMFLSSGYLKGTLPKGNFPCYKMRLGFYMLFSDEEIILLQNDFRFLKVFQLLKRWKLIKCNSQAVGTKCLAHPHFFILI